MKMPPGNVSVTATTSKTTRPREILDSPRQVHFTGEGTKVPITTSRGILKTQNQPASVSSSASKSQILPQQAQREPKREVDAPASPNQVQQENTQPQTFPGIGHFPGEGQSGVQWHRSVVPGQSLSSEFAAPALGSHLSAGHNTCGLPHPQNNGGFSTTFIGRQQSQTPSFSMSADYQNTGPPPRGQCFQPPVPDTTFGPMHHVYTPRFDAPGVMPPVPVCYQLVQFTPIQGMIVRTDPQAFFTPNYAYYPPAAPVPMGQFFLPQQQMYAGQHPMIAQTPMAYAQYPQMVQPFQPMPVPAQGGIMAPPGGGPPTVIPIMAGNPGPNMSEVAGVGRTPMEESVRQHQFAHSNKLFEPQDFKPSDDDPSRFYYVREVDGNWTQRNRFTIDNTGDCRWFVTPEGWFYAVRQPD